MRSQCSAKSLVAVGASDGSIDLPFCEIQDAVAKVGVDDPTAILVKPNVNAYSEQVQVTSGKTLAIVRDGNGVAKLEVSMFDALTEKLGGVFDSLTGRGALSEKDVDVALHEIVAGAGGMDAAAAHSYVNELIKAHRYLRDVY